MELSPGDKVRVLKDVHTKQFSIRPGAILEILWSKKKTWDHLYLCLNEKGRTRYIYRSDVLDGCFEKVYSAPVVADAATELRRVKKPTKEEKKLLLQIEELKESQNILLKNKNLEISMILKSKGTEMQRDDALADLTARLKTSMRNWVLGIQFNAQLTPMRKEIQNYLKELE